MAELGTEPSALLAVARFYAADLVDFFVIDRSDAALAHAIRAEGMEPVVMDSVMRRASLIARAARAGDLRTSCHSRDPADERRHFRHSPGAELGWTASPGSARCSMQAATGAPKPKQLFAQTLDCLAAYPGAGLRRSSRVVRPRYALSRATKAAWPPSPIRLEAAS